VEGLEARLVAALNACSHLLSADVARLQGLVRKSRVRNQAWTYKLPTCLRDLLNVLYWLLKGHIAERDLWDPHGTQQVCPFHSCRLLECTVTIWAEYAALFELVK
jgi:hypothetical protein